MDAPAAHSPPRYIRWLPYWAVLQTDLRQTVRGWVWRTWVLTSLFASIGFLLYKFGLYREAGILQRASWLVGDLLRWTLIGSGLLVVVLTVGSISNERGSLADSVLSRGISRYQYFLAKLHSRLISVVLTFTLLTALLLLASHFLLHEDLSLGGSLVALLVIAAILSVVVCCGVTMGALTHNAVLGVGLVWLLLYACGFLISLMPTTYPTPDRILSRLPQMLQGVYDFHALARMMGIALIVSVGITLFGLIGFARSDV